MKAFVTGSTGLLGSSVVRQLLIEGHEVVAMVRSAEKAQQFLGDSGAEVVEGNMLDIPALTPHLAACDVLFHVAAYFKEYTGADKDAEAMLQKINVDGTITLFDAAKAQGIKNIIYVSSSGVIGHAASGQPADETATYNYDTPNRYFQSKIRAEQAIESWLKQNPDMRVILILPGAIIGPGDNGPTGLGRLVLDVLHGELPATPPGGFSLVDVRDVANGMIRAVTQGESGSRFIIAGAYQTLPTLVRLTAEAGNVKAPAIQMPYPAAWLFGALSELGAKITGNPPLATRVLIKTLNERSQLSSVRAENVLGVTFRPIEDSIRDAVGWFREFGYA